MHKVKTNVNCEIKNIKCAERIQKYCLVCVKSICLKQTYKYKIFCKLHDKIKQQFIIYTQKIYKKKSKNTTTKRSSHNKKKKTKA